MTELPAEERRILVRTTRGADAATVVIEVSDRGTGIGAEAMRHLFEPFYTTKAHGMGMGLSIVRSIVESHGGLIVAANRPGGGAVFTVSLPAMAERAA
jgi:signal transduction histidine kinase